VQAPWGSPADLEIVRSELSDESQAAMGHLRTAKTGGEHGGVCRPAYANRHTAQLHQRKKARERVGGAIRGPLPAEWAGRNETPRRVESVDELNQ
jgi:hypothetical protein